MATEGSIAGLELFDGLNSQYEDAYGNNEFKEALVQKAISLIGRGSRVLDIGCGTGVPLAKRLADAGMEVVGVDISPKMIQIAKEQVKGEFHVADMIEYEPSGSFAAVFIIFSHLQIRYAGFHTVVHRAAKALQPGGILCIGQCPADPYVKDGSEYDETKSYCEPENLKIPFWGEDVDTLAMSREGQLEMLRSMGLEIVYDTVDLFHPKNPNFVPEYQQYCIGRRLGEQAISIPKPLPASA